MRTSKNKPVAVRDRTTAFQSRLSLNSNFFDFPAIIGGTEYNISPVFDEAVGVSFARHFEGAGGTRQAVFAYSLTENDN
jgi:hypothetical protein